MTTRASKAAIAIAAVCLLGLLAVWTTAASHKRECIPVADVPPALESDLKGASQPTRSSTHTLPRAQVHGTAGPSRSGTEPAMPRPQDAAARRTIAWQDLPVVQWGGAFEFGADAMREFNRSLWKEHHRVMQECGGEWIWPSGAQVWDAEYELRLAPREDGTFEIDDVVFTHETFSVPSFEECYRARYVGTKLVLRHVPGGAPVRLAWGAKLINQPRDVDAEREFLRKLDASREPVDRAD